MLKFSNNWATYEILFFLVYLFHIRNVYLPLELLSKITCYMNLLRFRHKNLKLTLFELCLFVSVFSQLRTSSLIRRLKTCLQVNSEAFEVLIIPHGLKVSIKFP